MPDILPPHPENKRDGEPPAFHGRDGALCVRDAKARGGWRRPSPHELPRQPLWRVCGFRDEG